MPGPKPWLRVIADWLVIAAGMLLGVLALSVTASRAGHQVDWLLAAGVAIPGFLLILGTAVAVLYSRKLGAMVCFVGAAVADALLVLPSAFVFTGGLPWSETLTYSLAVLLPACIPGAYWLITSRHGCPPVAGVPSRTVGRTLIEVGAFLITLYLLVGVGTIVVMGQYEPLGDYICLPTPLSVRQPSRTDAEFVAKVIFVGLPYRRANGKTYSTWAAASVQKEFWGLPWWDKRIVVLTFSGFANGETYFIDGWRGGGFLTLGVPVVQLKLCGSKRISDAAVELRVLQDGPPKNGIRIIGRVVSDYPDLHPKLVPGVRVLITGPNGTTATTTDREGIYDVQGLPPGSYTIRATALDETNHLFPSCDSREGAHLVAGEVWGCTLSYWKAPSRP